MNVLQSICQQIWKTHQWPQDWKMSVFIPILKKRKKEESEVTQSCLTLSDLMDPPASSIHGIVQSRVLEWIAISFSRGIFLTQGSNPGLLHCRQTLYCLSHQGIPKKGSAKGCSNYCTIALISNTSKVMLKILQARLQQYMNGEFPNVQAGFRKGRGTRNQIANIC